MRSISTAVDAEWNAEEATGFFLIRIAPSSTYCYTDCDIDLSYNGNTYQARGFDVGGIQQTPGFANDSVSIDLDNVDRTFSAIVLGEDCANAPASIYFQVLSSVQVPIGTVEIYNGFLSEWRITELRATLKFASEFAFWHKKSLRLPTPNCPWAFKSTECGYAGGESACDKTSARCTALGNYGNFGGRKFVSDVEDQEIYWGPK
jgi:hypothetical protein